MKSDRAHLQDIQVEQFKEIAAKLRETRETQGLSIEQLSTKTLIQRRLLYAIEAADIEQLPEMVYVRGFVKRYAEALGLDGQGIVDVLPVEGTSHSMKPSWKELPAAQLRPLHLYLLYIVVIALAVGGLSHFLRQVESPTVANNSSSPTTAPAEVIPDPAPQTSEVENTATNSNGEQPAATATDAENSDQPNESTVSGPIRVEVKLTAQSWMRITVDGTTEFEGVLQAGDERTWTAKEELTLRAGNAGGVMVAYNNGDAEPLGEPGSVEEITYPQTQSTARLVDAESTLPQ
ncbi:MAG: helix-turn-helix domain-containing protein [Thainema sp.]